MAHGFKESDFQNGIFFPYLTGHAPGQLGWILGKPGDVDPERWVVQADLLAFLRDGNPRNASAFAQARKQFDSDEACAAAFVDEALLPALEAVPNAAFLLREEIKFRNVFSFTLWNEAPRAGAASNAQPLFAKNSLRAIPEATFKRLFPITGKTITRRPDAVFFVNGVYFAYSELKTSQTGQTAKTHGRKKIAHNVVEAAVAALSEARARWEQAGGKWPGFRSRSLQTAEKNRIRQQICLYEKATHISCLDMGSILLIQDLDWLLADVDDAIDKDDRAAIDGAIPMKLIEAFMPAAEIRDKSPSETLADHLASLFDPVDGVDREIALFNQIRSSRTTTGSEILRPRPAQRAMLHQAMRRVAELYANEQKPKFSPDDIRARVERDLPGLDAAKMEEILTKASLHRNGADSHSILLQGAAGLGKTNVIVWSAQALADMADPRSPAAAPLFDCVVLLTDRTDLRKNVAEEAGRLRATKGLVMEAESFSDLRAALAGGARVVVVNIQKFPSMKRVAEQDPKLAELLRSKRVAIVIDEVHRSQNGILHDATIELFDEWGTLRPAGAKRNLIIGLTATPKDDILARLGEFRSPKAPGDDIRWAPYFAYTMSQAIREKVILNPIQNVLRFGDHIDYKIAQTVAKLSQDDKEVRAPNADEIYENPGRQRLVAKQAALVIAAKTIMAIRPPGGRALGEGKAMFAAHSIKAAIAYQDLIKEELVALASDARFSEHAETLKNLPVLVLYTDKQGEASCSEKNGGLSQEEIIDKFRRKGIESEPGLKVRNAVLVVVDKLLTGFDEPTLHTIFIDRGMDDVLLFQAACRVNRVRKWKNDCLIVDFSRDGVVSKNLPKVFAKYGGITVSDLDAMDMMAKMDAAYCAFFKDPGIDVQWKAWRAATPSTKLGTATALSDFLDDLVSKEFARAETLRKAASAWLSARSRLRGILDFARAELSKHNDDARASFAEQVLIHLRAKFRDVDDRVSAVFDVDMVEEADGWGLDELPEQQEKKERKKPGGPAEPRSPKAVADALEMLTALQLTEQQKLALIAKLKAFLSSLFKAMDRVGQSRNKGIHRKMILAMAGSGVDYPWEERFGKFSELLDAANTEPDIYTHPDRKSFLLPILKRSELVMADYEEWIVSSGSSLTDGQPQT